jgi:hypothetical protein
MGASIDIKWVDGPSKDEIEKIACVFAGKGFDGMIDLAYSHYSYITPGGEIIYGGSEGTQGSMGSVPARHEEKPEGAQRVRFGADYVTPTRYHSRAFIDRIAEQVHQKTRLDIPEIVEGCAWLTNANTPPSYSFNFDPWSQSEFRIYRETLYNTSAYVQPAAKSNGKPSSAPRTVESLKVEYERDWAWVYFPENPGKAITGILSEMGARFSKKRKGWYFTRTIEETEILQALENAGGLKPPPVEKEETSGDAKLAARMRKTADNMTGAINEKFADRLENTYRRQQIAQGQRAEGRNLQKTQAVMYKLADMWEAGTIPAGWEHLKSKKAVNEAIIYRDEPLHQELNDLAAVKVDHKAEKLRKLENEAKLMRLPGYFPTPDDIIERMLDYVNIEEGTKALEPSAGSGNIAHWMSANGAEVDICETSGHLRDILELKGYKLNGYDFLEHTKAGYEVIMMNPPFEKSQDIFHVMHAYNLLGEGGQLVAIMSEGPFFREDKNAREFRSWLDRVGGWSEKLPPGSFKESGTGTNARMVVIEK